MERQKENIIDINIPMCGWMDVDGRKSIEFAMENFSGGATESALYSAQKHAQYTRCEPADKFDQSMSSAQEN